MRNVFFGLSLVLSLGASAYNADDDMRVYPGTPACSDNYSTIDNCYNKNLPLPPAINRNLAAPTEVYKTKSSLINSGYQMPIDVNTAVFPTINDTTGPQAILPHTRTSNDGRLVYSGLATGPGLHVFHPERLLQDQKNKIVDAHAQAAPDGGRSWDNFPYQLHSLVYANPSNSKIKWSDFGNWFSPEAYQGTVCDASGSSGNYAPRNCQAQFKPGWGALKGDCYDVTILTGMTHRQTHTNGHKYTQWEFTSVDITAFVPDPKHNGTTNNTWPLVWVYPRTVTPTLPAWSPHYEHMEVPSGSIYDTGILKDRVKICQSGVFTQEEPVLVMRTASSTTTTSSGTAYFQEVKSNALPFFGIKSFSTAKTTSGTSLVTQAQLPPPPPDWCRFIWNQKNPSTFHVDDNGDNVVQGGETWSAAHCTGQPNDVPNCRGNNFFEMSTTDDGRLIIMNFGDNAKGLYYSYNSKGACRADGWTKFKPLTHMPFDPEVNMTYDMAKMQRNVNGDIMAFRNARGNHMPAGTPFHGAYPWIDRKGKNLFFAAMNSSRDTFKAKSMWPPSYNTPNSVYETLLPGYPDINAGKAMSLIGTWTQGKTVVLDHQMSISDWGGKSEYKTLGSDYMAVPYTYNMRLYDTGPETKVRPRGLTSVFSVENQWNFYEAMAPTMPFDVVWLMGANTNFNAEIVFDEYMMNQAFVVAHMTAQTKIINNDQFLDDGFHPENPGQHPAFNGEPKFGFKSNPKVQNAATSDTFFHPDAEKIPAELRLRGGARIEPVYAGGVKGKGVYFDGKNDFMDMGFQNPKSNDWTLSIWLDNRESDRNKVRTLFWFPDGSWIGMSKNQIHAFNSKAPLNQRLQVIDISNMQLWAGHEYHSLTVKVYSAVNQRRLEFYIDGTYVNKKVNNTFATNMAWNYPSGSVWDQGFQLKLTYMNGWSWFVVGDPGTGFNSDPVPTANRASFKGWIDEFRIYALKPQDRGRSTFWEEFICNLSYGSLTKVKEADTHPLMAILQDKAGKHNLWASPPSPYPDKATANVDVRAVRISDGSTGTGTGTTTTTGTTTLASTRDLSSVAQPVDGKTGSEPFSGTTTYGGLEDAANYDHDTPIDVDVELGVSDREAVVCEQLKIHSHTLPKDFPDQHDRTVCASRTHSKPMPGFEDRCMRKLKHGVHNKALVAGQPRPDFSSTPFCLSCHHSTSHFEGFHTDALTQNLSINREHDPRRQPLDWPKYLRGCRPNRNEFGPTWQRCDVGTLYVMDFLMDPVGKLAP